MSIYVICVTPGEHCTSFRRLSQSHAASIGHAMLMFSKYTDMNGKLMGWTVLAASPFKTCGLTETAELRSCADLNSVALELQGGRLRFVVKEIFTATPSC